MNSRQSDFAAAVLCVIACAAVVASLPVTRHALPAAQPVAVAAIAVSVLPGDTSVPAAGYIFAGNAYAEAEAASTF